MDQVPTSRVIRDHIYASIRAAWQKAPGAVLLSICTVAVAIAAASAQDAPESIYGTRAGEIELFTPASVVSAGGGSENAYKLFAQRNLSVGNITTSTDVPATGIVQVWTAEETFSDGLIPGPFITTYEGTLSYDVGSETAIRGFVTEVAIKHEFSDGKTLTSKRMHVRSLRRNSAGATPLTSLSSITDLQLGTVKADDGSDIVITAALLAEPVKITLTATYTIINASGAGIAATLDDLSSQNAKVTYWQLQRVTGGGGGGGTATPLSNATPQPDAGSGAAGTATAASRGDHAHPATPNELPAQSAANAARVLARSTQASGVLWDTTADVVERGLPARTGKGGEFLRVTEDAAGIEWAQGSGLPDRTGKGGEYLRVTTDASAVEWADLLSDSVPPNVGKTAGAAGTATDASRSDHTHRTAFVASTTTPRRPSGNGLAGTSTQFSRGDHVHPSTLGSAIPKAASGTGAQGTAINSSREDHVHPATSGLPPHTDANAGDFLILSSQPSNVRPIWAEAHNAVLTGLPALTGHGGNFLAVNSGATGVEWKAAGGGGGSGGLTAVGSFTLNGTLANKQKFQDTGLNVPQGAAWFVFLETASTLVRNNVTEKGSGDFAQFVRVPNLPTATIGAAFVFNSTANSNVLFLETGEGIALDGSENILMGWNSNFPGSATYEVYQWTPGGGGGGSSGPSIPTPTAAGALKLLRVNAAGAAYELADPPDVQSVSDELDAVQKLTSDLTPYPSTDDPTFTANTSAANAKIVFIPDSPTTPDISGAQFVAADPGANAGKRGYFLVAVASGHDKARYRVQFTSATSGAYEFNGNGWQSVTPSAGGESGFSYWAATPIGEVIGSASAVELQAAANENHVGKTTYAGDPTIVSPWAKAGLANGGAGQALGMNAAGTEPMWYDPVTLQSTGVPGTDTTPGERGSGMQAARWDHRHTATRQRFTIKAGSSEDCCDDNFIALCATAGEKAAAIAPFRVAGYTATSLELFLWYSNSSNEGDGIVARHKFIIGGLAPGQSLPTTPASATTTFRGGYSEDNIRGPELEIAPDGGCRIDFETIKILPGRTVNYRLDAVMEVD